MIQATPSQNFAADIQTANNDGIVVLHQFRDGMLLAMTFDDEMPAFTTKPTAPGAPLEINGKDAVTTATGYVFRIAEPDVNGTFEFEGRRYAFIEIEDYVVWTDEGAVREKYKEVMEKVKGK